MTGRFITPLEQEYDKKFPDCKESKFFPDTDAEAYFALLQKAIERGEAIKHEEMVELWGEEEYERERVYLREWGYPDA